MRKAVYIYNEWIGGIDNQPKFDFFSFGFLIYKNAVSPNGMKGMICSLHFIIFGLGVQIDILTNG
jgi:hypothetical protein